jgi:hypothetical protein
MTLPTVRAVSKKYGTKVDYATDPGYLDGALVKVLQYNPYIHTVLNWRDMDVKIYDAVIELTCPCVAYEKPLCKPINRSDLFARHAGVHLDEHTIDYTITPEEAQWAKEYLEQHNLDRFTLVMVQPSSSTTKRDAPIDKLKKIVGGLLAVRRDIRALVITHESDTIKTDWGFADVHCLANLDIRQLAALMPHTNLVLCPDSAILHVAAALHHPTVTLFGPTDPHARVNYHPEAVAVWPGKELKNYPCWYEDPRDGYLCWKRLEEQLVIRVMVAMLNEQPLPESRDLVTFGKIEQEQQFYEVL